MYSALSWPLSTPISWSLSVSRFTNEPGEISNRNFSATESPGHSERTWSGNFDAPTGGEYPNVGGHFGWQSDESECLVTGTGVRCEYLKKFGNTQIAGENLDWNLVQSGAPTISKEAPATCHRTAAGSLQLLVMSYEVHWITVEQSRKTKSFFRMRLVHFEIIGTTYHSPVLKRMYPVFICICVWI